jgi:hypothetical protein
MIALLLAYTPFDTNTATLHKLRSKTATKVEDLALQKQSLPSTFMNILSAWNISMHEKDVGPCRGVTLILIVKRVIKALETQDVDLGISG